MSSFMTRHFKWYEMICKSCGLLFLHNSKTSESDDAVCSWNKVYLIYSLVCISVCALVEISYFYEIWLAVFSHDLVFTTTLYVVIYTMDLAKAMLNATLTFVKARSLQKFFHESSEYEQQVRFKAPQESSHDDTSYLSIKFIDQLGCVPALGATLKFMSIAGNFVFYVLDAAPFLVIRPCCEVIRLYIEHQHGVLRCIVRSGGDNFVGPEKRARLVEKVRLDLCTISHIKRSLNGIWQHAIAVSGATVICISCVGIYLNFVEEYWTLEHLLSIMYTVSTVLDFLDIAILSDAMVREVQSMRYTLQKVVTSSENGDYVDQVRLVSDYFYSVLIRQWEAVRPGLNVFCKDHWFLTNLSC
ncbi:hypothetical protein MRX96_024166 [Rhipicephalus microplus]